MKHDFEHAISLGNYFLDNHDSSSSIEFVIRVLQVSSEINKICVITSSVQAELIRDPSCRC